MTCTVCGQPLPKARSNQLTCSPKCRTRRYRQAQPRPLKGSGRFRQNLMIAQPAPFFKLQPDTTYEEVGKAIGVPEPQWDQTLALLNELWHLLEPIDIILMWQGEAGYTPTSEESNEELDIADVGTIVLQELGHFRQRLARLPEWRGPWSSLLARQLVELDQCLTELVDPSRQYVRQLFAQSSPYEVAYPPAMQAGLSALQMAVERSWFAIYDQVV